MDMEELYRRIALKNGVSAEEVRKEIQKAIDEAWKNPPEDGGATRAYQSLVPCRGSIPTPEELIRYAAREIYKNSSRNL